jgi:hypothetical protein
MKFGVMYRWEDAGNFHHICFNVVCIDVMSSKSNAHIVERLRLGQIAYCQCNCIN